MNKRQIIMVGRPKSGTKDSIVGLSDVKAAEGYRTPKRRRAVPRVDPGEAFGVLARQGTSQSVVLFSQPSAAFGCVEARDFLSRETNRRPGPCERKAAEGCRSPKRRQVAFTLIETIAVLAVIAILAAVMAPSFIKRIDRAVWTKETANLNNIADALTQSIIRTKSVPDAGGWATAVANQMSLPVSAVLTNGRRYARAFLLDPSLSIGAGLPYTQTINGTDKPANARVIILSSLAAALPIASGVPPSADFNNIWNAPENTVPLGSPFAGWAGTGEDLRIKKLNLGPMFYQLILFNHDPPNADPTRDAPFSIDRGATINVASGPPGRNKYYLGSSDLWLLDSNLNVRTRYLLGRDISFIFESGSWRGQIQGGATFNDNDTTASDFIKLATAFYSAPTSTRAQSAGITPSAVLVSMYTFMFDYVFWATQCPHFNYHGFPTNTTPSNLPEYNLLNDIGSPTAQGSLGKYTGGLVN